MNDKLPLSANFSTDSLSSHHRCLLVYDIPDDGKRNKVADACLDYGLDRIQYSAFLGKLQPTHMEELMLKITKILGKKPAKVLLIPICLDDWGKHKFIERVG